jgi:uncharacterized protein (TIGR00297 family)
VDTWWLAVTLFALTGLALLAWSLEVLDRYGAGAAWVLGLWVALGAGLGWLLLMTTFTVVGVLTTAYGKRRKALLELAAEDAGERTWRNVVANGAAAALAVLAYLLLPEYGMAATLAFTTAVAASTADTMASEIGCLSPKPRRIVTPFEVMPQGANGAVSLRGQVAAAIGATLISAAAFWLVALPLHLLWIPALAGFFGCQLDSVLGATLEKDAMQDKPLSKQDVNFLASAVPALIVLVVTALL